MMQPFCAPCNPNRWINFTLEVLAPPVNMSGDYTVTFTAAEWAHRTRCR